MIWIVKNSFNNKTLGYKCLLSILLFKKKDISGIMQWFLLFSVLVVCVSNLTLTVTIIDRFLATLQSPLQKYTQDHMVIVMLIVWVFGMLLSLPYILYTRFIEFDWIGGHERLCQAHFPSMESRRAYVTIFCLVGYVLPMLVMFFLISVSLRRPGVPNDSMPREERTRCKMRRRVSTLQGQL